MKTKTGNILLALCLSATLVATVTVAAAPVVQVGEVNASIAKGALVAKHFSKTVHDSVAKLDTAGVKDGPYLISASLVRLNSKNGDYGVQATVVVETTLRHKRSGSLIGMTRGQATASAPGGSVSDAQKSALRAAMESALKSVPSALAQR